MSVIEQLNLPYALNQENLRTKAGLNNAGVFVLAQGAGSTFMALHAAKTGDTPLRQAIESAVGDFGSAEHFYFQICTPTDQDDLLRQAKRRFNL